MAPFKFRVEDKESEIQHIIQKLTSTGRRTLDENEMKKLKKICKVSDNYVKYAYYALITQLRKDHAEIRYSSLLVINELFCRSSVFRKLLELDLEEFLQLVEETDPEKPLPLPQPAAKELKVKGLEFMKNWCTKFRAKHTRLQLAINFLKKCKKVDFNDMEVRTTAQRERQRQEQERIDRVTNERIAKVKQEMQDLSEEIYSVITQINSCFHLLIPNFTDDLFSPLDFEKSENVNSSTDDSPNDESNSIVSNNETIDAHKNLRHHGFYDMKKTITIEIKKDSEVAITENENTLPVIENLKDLEKEISNRFYPTVSKWIKVLTKGNNCSEQLKRAIDLKLSLEAKLEKLKELKIKPSKLELNDNDDDSDDFEEVKEKEGYEESVQQERIRKTSLSQPTCSKYIKISDDIEETLRWKFVPREEDVKDPTSAASTLKKRLKKLQSSEIKIESKNEPEIVERDEKHQKACLLEKAPILPYDIDLYHWEEEKPLIPERVKFDSLHKFWETKDDDENDDALKEVQIASLRTRKIDFSGKFEPVKWTCRAPLPSGKLCPRKDRYKCPFHGKIIPRDELGNPSGDPSSIPGPSTESSSSVPDWQDPQLLRDIEAATGIDLKIPEKGKKGKKRKSDGGLTNIKQIKNTTRERLTKKIIKRYQHYAPKLDEIDRKRFNDKFGDQWNYY